MGSEVIKAQNLIAQGTNADAELANMTKLGKRMLNSFSQWFSGNRVRFEHWSAIQATLKLPEYTGMGGAQNTSVFLLGEVLGVATPEHDANKKLETIAEMHFVPHQREVVKYFRE